MTTPRVTSSLPAIRLWFLSIETKQGGLATRQSSAVGAHSRCSYQISGTAARQLRDAQFARRTFSYSTKPQQRQRLTLRPVNTKKKNGNRRSGRGAGQRSTTAGQQQQQQQQRRRRIPPYVYFLGGIPFVGGLYLYFRFQDFVPLTGRRRFLATEPEYEKRMGDENYQQLLTQYRSNILPRHHPATIIIERVGRRIFNAAKIFATKKDLIDSFDTNNVTFTVVNSDQVNAFVLPGNHVFFLTGMFKYARTEDEIAGILGHEMAHNLARHQGEKISSNAVVSIIAALSLLIDPSGNFLTIFMPAAKLFGELPNSRHHESEADEIGMRLAVEACYDPEAMSHVFRRMDEAGKDRSDQNLAVKPPEFLSTHPSDESRIKDMQKWLPEDKRIFNMYDGERCREFRRELNNATNNRPFQSSTSRENSGSDGLPCWK